MQFVWNGGEYSLCSDFENTSQIC